MLSEALRPYRYLWPWFELQTSPYWQAVDGKCAYIRPMPESVEALAADSRWPAFFPSPICYVTTADGTYVALEKVVGASRLFPKIKWKWIMIGHAGRVSFPPPPA